MGRVIESLKFCYYAKDGCKGCATENDHILCGEITGLNNSFYEELLKEIEQLEKMKGVSL